MGEAIDVNGIKVWFERIGSGPNVVLLIPGPIGTPKTDFNELIDSEDEIDFDKFTVIAVDPPGQGKSRPPQRKYGKELYNIDCEAYHQVMKHLSINAYSIVGWSEGAKVALLMAIRYPTEVEALVLVGITYYMSNRNIASLKANQSVDKWPKSKIEDYLRGYDSKEEIQKQWTRYLNFAEFYNQYFPEDIFKGKYQNVKCYTLIVHGDKDPTVELEQSTTISKRLPFARVHRFPNGEYGCHQKYSLQFTKLVQDHILNRGDLIKSIIEEEVVEKWTTMN